MIGFLSRWQVALSARAAPRPTLCMSGQGKSEDDDRAAVPLPSDPYAAVKRYHQTEKGKEARRRAAKAFRDRNKEKVNAYDRSPKRRAANADQTKIKRQRDRGLRTLLLLILIYDGLFFEVADLVTAAVESESAIDRALVSGLSALDSPLFVRHRILWLWFGLTWKVDRRYTDAVPNPRARPPKSSSAKD